MPKIDPIVTAYVLMDDDNVGISSVNEVVTDEDKKEMHVKMVMANLCLSGLTD